MIAPDERDAIVSTDSAQTPRAAATRLETLARQAERLRPDHRDPEAFHCQKSELVHALRLLAREVLHG